MAMVTGGKTGVARDPGSPAARRVSTIGTIMLLTGVLIRNFFPAYYTLGTVALVTGAFVLAGGLITELTLGRRGRRGHGKAD